MSIFDIFSGKSNQQQQQQQSQQPAPNASGSQHVQNNPTVPTANNTVIQQPQPDNPTPESPVAKFDDLWKWNLRNLIRRRTLRSTLSTLVK